jgi:serine phosphatase RsbU (regulator of sigma subunit)
LDKLGIAQRRLLPQSAPVVDGYALCLVYRPSYIATGDYHDFFRGRNGCPAAFVGDGSGHGPTASILTATMRTILRTHPALLETDPGDMLTAANQMFHALIPADLFMTGLYVLLGDGGRVSWACAGQDPPLRVNRRGQPAPVDLTPAGLPLGVEPAEVYATVHWHLEPGERLLLFTDGLVEVRGKDGKPFGRPRLRSDVAELSHLPLADLVRELVSRAAAHARLARFDDDFTILGIERQVPALFQAELPKDICCEWRG